VVIPVIVWQEITLIVNALTVIVKKAERKMSLTKAESKQLMQLMINMG
jgi:hypothetical protein